MLGTPTGGGYTTRLTIADLLSLWLESSPFVMGGAITEDAVEKARRVLGSPDLSASSLLEDISCALRGFEIIQTDTGKAGHSGGDYDGISPEWAADIFASVCRVAPSTTWEDFLHRYPLALVAHLCAASHRANGGHTARPSDFASAFRELKAFRGNG